MKILGKILGAITLILGILLICAHLVYYINESIPEASKFLPPDVISVFNYVKDWAALIVVGAMVLTTMMKHSIVLTIIFAVLIGAVAVFMIVGQTSGSATPPATPENPEEFVNAIKALVC